MPGEGMYINGEKLNPLQVFMEGKEIQKFSVRIDKNLLILESKLFETG
jgi:hypothetical protein